MELHDLPQSLVVIGGGYVGVEQAQLFAHLGCAVTLVGRLAPGAEPELADLLRAVFAGDGITVIEEHAVDVESTGTGVAVTTTSGRRVAGQRLLVTTGRRARTDGLNLSAAGIEVDAVGFIVVDAHQRTTNHRVYGAGDVTGSPQYVYVAAAAGRVAATNALGIDGAPSQVDYAGMPQVMFTRPQLASAGFTEAQALARGYRCESRVLDLAGMTVEDIANTWAPYLTMAESLRLVAGLFRDEVPTSCCA